jgi:hypothetical protein
MNVWIGFFRNPPINNKRTLSRVKCRGGTEHVYTTKALKVFRPLSRAASMLIDSVYFPALATMLFEACVTNPSIKAMLLKQATVYANSLRPLEMFGEPSCGDILRRLWQVMPSCQDSGATRVLENRQYTRNI